MPPPRHPGIIPALAGNRLWSMRRRWRRRDHPRTRREQGVIFPTVRVRKGSSPHSQGTVQRNAFTIHIQRIIPALAGNSLSERRRRQFRGDHPRTRREQHGASAPVTLECGSSPHSQGTVPLLSQEGDVLRIIPALAGNRSRRRSTGASRRDHPRTRREQMRNPGVVIDGEGSSPHSQGTAERR